MQGWIKSQIDDWYLFEENLENTKRNASTFQEIKDA